MTEEEAALHKRLDSIIDIKKPLIPQVEKLTNREFLAFVRRPRYIEDTDAIKLFEDPVEDQNRKSFFGKNLQKLIPMVLSFAVLGVYFAESWQAALWNHFLYGWVLGLVACWTFTEYFFHRFMLHRELNLDLDAPADGKQNAAIFSSHVHHHVFTNQKHRIVLNMPMYCRYISYATPILLLLLPLSEMFSLGFGWIGGSVIYDLCHYAFHHGPDLPFPWFESMKAAHMRHHYRDNSKEFGVTVPVWDSVFSTSRGALETPKDFKSG